MKAYVLYADGGTSRLTAPTKAALFKRADAIGATSVRIHIPHGRRGQLQYETTERYLKQRGKWTPLAELGSDLGDVPASARKGNPSLVAYLANPSHGVQIASDVQAILYRHAKDGAYYLHIFGNHGDGELMKSRGREYLRIDNLPARTGVQLVGHGKVLTVRHRDGRALEREF